MIIEILTPEGVLGKIQSSSEMLRVSGDKESLTQLISKLKLPEQSPEDFVQYCLRSLRGYLWARLVSY